MNVERVHRRGDRGRRDYAENLLTSAPPLRPLRLCGESRPKVRFQLATTAEQSEPKKVELKRDLNKLESYATIIGILVGSGIFVVTGEQGKIAGPSVPLGYIVLAPIILATALAYSVYLSTPLGTRPGDAYTHISRTTGSYYLGFIALWLKWIAYIGALVILSTSFGKYLKFFYPNMDQAFAQVLPFGQSLAASFTSGPSLGEAVYSYALAIVLLRVSFDGSEVLRLATDGYVHIIVRGCGHTGLAGIVCN